MRYIVLIVSLIFLNIFPAKSDCYSGFDTWAPSDGCTYSSEGRACINCGYRTAYYDKCYCLTGQLNCKQGCLACAPGGVCLLDDFSWISLYFPIVVSGSFISIVLFWKRITNSYVDKIPKAQLKITPYDYYTPKNPLHVTWIPNTEVHTSGEISTSYYGYGNNELPYVHGSISSESIITSYTIVITYDGPWNIGDRNLRKERIPNYLTKVSNELTHKTHINPDGNGCKFSSPYSSLGCDWFINLSIFTFACFMCLPCYNTVRAKRKIKFETELEALASNSISRHIASLMQEADQVATKRVDCLKNQEAKVEQGNAGGGQITLTAEQLQQLIMQAQAGRVVISNDMGNNVMLPVNAMPSADNRNPNLIDELL